MSMPALDQIAAPGAGSAVSGAGIEVMAGLSVSLGRIAGYMQARQDYQQRCQQAIRSVPIQPVGQVVAGGDVTITDPGNLLGPATGYNWAVQRLTGAGLAAADSLSFYRGPAIAATVQPNNLLQVVTGAAPTWHPGRTGLILNAGDTLVASGSSLTATGEIFLTGEIIIMESWLLPEFLL